MLSLLKYLFSSLFLFILPGLCSSVLAIPPQIVVSIKPIHSITSHITEGITIPSLLLPDGASPHTFLLKPSHRKTVQQADLLIWVGENCETHLHKIMQQYPTKSLTLMAVPDLMILPVRADRDFSLIRQEGEHKYNVSHHKHDHHSYEHTHGASDEDAHIWLSIANAKIITQVIRDKLIEIDPTHTEQYQKNAARYQKQLDNLSAELHQSFATVKPAPYLVFHDAYQYFEKEFQIESVGTILLNPHVPLTARALNHIQNLMNRHKVTCLFYEPEFNYQPLKPILKEKGLTLLELDPLGVQQTIGLGSYEAMMRQLAKQLQSCHVGVVLNHE